MIHVIVAISELYVICKVIAIYGPQKGKRKWKWKDGALEVTRSRRMKCERQGVYGVITTRKKNSGSLIEVASIISDIIKYLLLHTFLSL